MPSLFQNVLSVPRVQQEGWLNHFICNARDLRKSCLFIFAKINFASSLAWLKGFTSHSQKITNVLYLTKEEKKVNCFRLYSLAARLRYFRFLFITTMSLKWKEDIQGFIYSLIWIIFGWEAERTAVLLLHFANREIISAYNPTPPQYYISSKFIKDKGCYCFFLYI